MGSALGWAGHGQPHLAPRVASCQTPKEDLCSKFGMDLKRGMLLRLARQDPELHPDNPKKRAAIYEKYKVRALARTSCSLRALLAGASGLIVGLVPPVQEFVIPEAEAEWVGLTLDEALEKQRLLEEQVSMCEHQPLSTSRQMGWGQGCLGEPGLVATALGGSGEEPPQWSHGLGFPVARALPSRV